MEKRAEAPPILPRARATSLDPVIAARHEAAYRDYRASDVRHLPSAAAASERASERAMCVQMRASGQCVSANSERAGNSAVGAIVRAIRLCYTTDTHLKL